MKYQLSHDLPHQLASAVNTQFARFERSPLIILIQRFGRNQNPVDGSTIGLVWTCAFQIMEPVMSVGDQVFPIGHQEIELAERGKQAALQRQILEPGGRGSGRQAMEILGDMAEQMAEGIFRVRPARGAADRVIAGQFYIHDIRHHAVVSKYPFLATTYALKRVRIAYIDVRRKTRLADMRDDQV